MNVSKLEMENERSEAALACSGSGLDKLWFRIWNHNFFTDQEIKVVVWNTGEMFHALQKRQNSLRQVQIKKKKKNESLRARIPLHRGSISGAGTQVIPFRHSVQTDGRSHSVACLLGKEDPLPGDKTVGA